MRIICLSSLISFFATESPPLTRGTLALNASGQQQTRITPACAGNTNPSINHICILWDHPRLRGEYVNTCLQVLTTVGSPPPTRGIHKIPLPPVCCSRITPAYAGTTFALITTTRGKKDHPPLARGILWMHRT